MTTSTEHVVFGYNCPGSSWVQYMPWGSTQVFVSTAHWALHGFAKVVVVGDVGDHLYEIQQMRVDFAQTEFMREWTLDPEDVVSVVLAAVQHGHRCHYIREVSLYYRSGECPDHADYQLSEHEPLAPWLKEHEFFI